jgi:hypothetical protein
LPCRRYQLGFDLDVATLLFRDFCRHDFWRFVASFDGRGRAAGGSDARIHFLRAGKNPLWLERCAEPLVGMPQLAPWVPDPGAADEGQELILDRFARITQVNDHVKMHTMPHVGHWLHVEDVRGLMSKIAQETRF